MLIGRFTIMHNLKCSSNFKKFYFGWSEKSDNSIQGIQGIQCKFLTATFRGSWAPTLPSISSDAYMLLRIQTSKLLYILEWKCKYSKWSWDLLMKEMINTKLSFIFCMKKHYCLLFCANKNSNFVLVRTAFGLYCQNMGTWKKVEKENLKGDPMESKKVKSLIHVCSPLPD